MNHWEAAACFVSLLSWTSIEDFAKLAVTFSADAEPEDADLSNQGRERLAVWRSSKGFARGVAFSSARAVFARCQNVGADVLHPFAADYPSALLAIAKPPIFLSRIGGAPWAARPTLSIFGSREPSPMSLAWMDAHIPEFLSKVNACVASGGARGIDRKAHVLAITCGRPTVVFLPSGLAAPYPSDLADWYARVRDGGGATLSEFTPDQQVRKHCFERRNRMIAGIADVAFAVEGRRRSGTLMTARMAADCGRTVCALSGSSMDARAAGTIDLLHDGAVLIRDAADLTALLTGNYMRTRPQPLTQIPLV